MEELVRAFLDDYDKVTVVIKHKFYDGKADRFYFLDGEKAEELEVKNTAVSAVQSVYTLKLNHQLIMGNEYQVMLNTGYRADLEYRFIVKTDRFNEEFYYDGDDLGSVIKGNSTQFALWAPTASRVLLETDGQSLEMNRSDKGVYRLTVKENLAGKSYHYLIKVNGVWRQSNDPYGKASAANSEDSVVADVEKYRTRHIELPKLEKYTDAIIYETSVRDCSEEGIFKTVTENDEYLNHLGITHLQLMPVNDFGSVNELHPKLSYNWGYDPVQYQCLEGSYSSDVSDPFRVMEDFRGMVEQLHNDGIKVNLDVVFNHVYFMNSHPLELSVPYYYFRYDDKGMPTDGSYCGNEIDSGMPMMRKYIIDTLVYYVRQFDVDGFRFDILGLLDIETINKARQALVSIKPDIMMYGEGWNMNTILPQQQKACKENWQLMPGIGHFNDIFRDNMKGSTFSPERKGYITGDPSLLTVAERCLKGLIVGLPENSVNYVECHDEMTVYDKLKVCCGGKQIEARAKLLLGCVILAQGIPFIHSGQEHLRTKRGLHNSFNAGDEINKLRKHDREIHRDMVEYTRKLIALRKQLRLAKTAEEIRRDVSTEEYNGCILYEIHNCAEGRDIIVIVNPTENTIDYDFTGRRVLFGEESIKPVSLTVLERMHND